MILNSGGAPGLLNYNLGEKGGDESVPLSIGQIPSHGHSISASSNTATSFTAGGTRIPAMGASPNNIYYPSADNKFPDFSIGASGGSQPVKKKIKKFFKKK